MKTKYGTKQYIRKSHSKSGSTKGTAKLSQEALYNEWQDYQKWYNKQAAKGLTVSGRSRIIAGSFEQYLFYRNQFAQGITKSSDALAEMERLSFDVSSRQIEHLVSEIEGAIEKASPTQVRDFFARFGKELPMRDGRIDAEAIVYQNLRDIATPLQMRTGKNHGWYGLLADAMNYWETLGFTVNWNS